MSWAYPGFSGQLDDIVIIGTGGPCTNLAFNSANTRLGKSFVARYAENITGFKVLHSSSFGSPTSTVVEVKAADANGKPTGSVLGTKTYTPTSNDLNTVTLDSAITGLSVGDPLCVYWKNDTGTPGSNFFRLAQTMGNGIMLGRANIDGMGLSSTDGGTIWHPVFNNMPMIAPIYATAGADAPIVANGGRFTSGRTIYSTAATTARRVAILWNCPIAVELCWIAVHFYGVTGSPSYNLCGEICSSSASLYTSDAVIPAAQVGTNIFQFTTPRTLPASTDRYLGIVAEGGDVTAGSSSHNANCLTAQSLIAAATRGPIKGGYYSGISANSVTPSWVSISGEVPVIELGIRIPAAGGSSSILCQRGMNGGFPR